MKPGRSRVPYRTAFVLPFLFACASAPVAVPQPTVPRPAAPAAQPSDADPAEGGGETAEGDVIDDELAAVDADMAIDVGVEVSSEPWIESTFVLRIRHPDGEVERATFGPYPGLCGYGTDRGDLLAELSCWAPSGAHALRVTHEGDVLVVAERAGDAPLAVAGEFPLPSHQTVGFR